MVRSHVRIALYVSLALILCLPAGAWQQSIGGAAGSAGNISLPTYDGAGRVVAVTDSTGNTVRTGGGAATLAAAAAHAANVTAQPAAAPVTIHVPADQPTIQTAIDAAANGDTVLVSDGTYKENINFKGKAITVTSVNGPATTTIDGGGVDSVVTFNTGEGAGSVLNGFTITNGNGFEGGGIFVSSSSTITNNVITANAGCNGGGGIAVNFAAPLVEGNTINNNAQGDCGGGIGGGGISIGGESSGTRIIGNIISNNTWGSGGGGIALFAAGGPLIQDNIITGNNGGNQGGGLVMFNDASPQIIGNVFSHNSAFNGGGLYWLIPQSTPGILLLNNTITNNSATQGSAIFTSGFDDNTSIQNNAIIGQAGVDSVFCESFNSNTPPGFTANDIFVAGALPYGGICSDQTGLQGNVSADPLFVDTAVDNFHLQPASPAINTGNNTARIALPATDIDGNTRVFNSTVDIGAFEFQGTTTATFSSTSLTFPDTLLGTTSAAQNVTITNTGATALQITPFTITGEFAETDDCHTSHGLAAGKTCMIGISFLPTVSGPQTGTLTVTSNEAASPTVIHLSGVGIGPVVSLSTTTLTFANHRVGVTSSSQPVVLKNTGVTALAISSIVATGDFAQTNDCGSTVGVNASCTINVTFTPTLRGTRNGADYNHRQRRCQPAASDVAGTGHWSSGHTCGGKCELHQPTCGHNQRGTGGNAHQQWRNPACHHQHHGFR